MTLLMSSLRIKIEKMQLGDTGKLSPIFLDYLRQEPNLEPFYGRFPTINSFANVLKEKQFDNDKRTTLAQVLSTQYHSLNCSDKVLENIQMLKDGNTFTITTGHQLNIFSGPLYFIYKIVTTINACKSLKKAYPDFNFIPVYWMASEDHDFDEISFFRLFNKKYVWESDQKGPVGKFDPSSLKTLIEEIPEKIDLFERAYLQNDNLADATRYFVNELFGEEGLVIIDADDKTLKSEFTSVMKDDIFSQKPFDLVSGSSAKLKQLGYKSQVNPRPINFFYMERGLRERIVSENGQFSVTNTDKVFSMQAMEDLIASNPEKLSPNVILRPVYQETILPNLAYIGGAGELAYWLQLKTVFSHYDIGFPMLMPRNFCLYINKGNARKILKSGISVRAYFDSDIKLKENYINQFGGNEVVLEREKEILKEVFESIKNLAKTVDKSLEGLVGAEANKAGKGLDNIEKRLKKAEESKYEQNLKSLLMTKERLFPAGKLQERTDNFLNFYINNPEFIQHLLSGLDPFDYRFHILTEDE